MSVHLHRDLEELRQRVLSMGGNVEAMVHKAVESLTEPSIDLALALAQDDEKIDRLDVEIEEECLKMLALHQPFAVDLRRITTAVKICSELERVADLCVHIAERAAALEQEPDAIVPNKLKRMAQMSVEMLHESIDSYVDLDSTLALSIGARDDAVDEMNREIIEDVKRLIQQSPDRVDTLLQFFSISRHLERIADHATNIAEDVIYLDTGKIIRHRSPIERESAIEGNLGD